jgi:CubicO group peptidase (beta-lactamase class C family)
MKKHLLFIYLLLLTSLISAQVEKNSELYQIILEKDSLLFNVGFNHCDLTQFEHLVSDDFEFYHDKGGAVKLKSEFISNIKSGVCNLAYKATRKLDSTRTEVYPLHKNGTLYGVIQKGIHRFYAKEENRPEYITSVAKFTHLWLLENGIWKLSRSLSFDHTAFDKPINQELLFNDENETERWLKQKSIPALGIGYVEDGKIKQVSVFGELEKGIQAPKNTIWNVASLTKPIVTMITLKLVNAGVWDLDEPIYHYWIDPDVKKDRRHKKLTTRYILSHQTGLPNWRWDDEESKGKLRFQFEPGSNYQYSGEGFEYLKNALENKFNQPLSDLADSILFKPLEMNDTWFYWDDEMAESRFAKWHSATGVLYETHKSSEASAADDLLTTVEDYSKLVAHILDGAGLTNSLQKEMVKEQIRLSSVKYWGLGFWIDENINENGAVALVHGGDDIGVHTIVFMIPETKQGLVIFTNSDNGPEAFQEVLLNFLGDNGQGILEVEMKR